MKIVFLSPTLGDAYGQERVLEREVTFLKQSGHSIYLIGDQLLGPPPFCDAVISISGLSQINSLSPLKRTLEIKNKLLKELNKIEPDLVHFVDQFDSRLMGLIAQRYPAVLTAHTVAPSCPSSQRFLPREGGVCTKKSGWGCLKQTHKTGCLNHFKSPIHRIHAIFEYKQKRRALKDFVGVAAISPYMERTLLHDGFSQHQVFPLYNFIDDCPASPLAKKIAPPLFLVVARFVPLKGVDSLLKNLQLIKHLNWQCWIFGEGPLKAGIESLTKDFELCDRIQFKGKCPPREVHEAFKKASVFIQPNRGPEGFGLAVAEAISQKVPVLAYDVPALNDLVISGLNGVLVPLQNEFGLAPELEKMIKEPTYLESLSQKDPDLFATYSTENHFKNLLTFYEKAKQNFKERP